METYSTKQLANLFGLHPNTIRLYERLDYISKADRKANGYRMFTQLHVLQMGICRRMFGYPYTNYKIRQVGLRVIEAAAKKQWSEAKREALQYLQVLRQEVALAEETAAALQAWATRKAGHAKLTAGNKRYSRSEIAAFLGVTGEAVRNWERNGLIISVGTGSNQEKLFDESGLERTRVIYMLRQAGYGMSALHRCMAAYDEGMLEAVLPALHQPARDELLSAGDRWLYEIKKLKQVASDIPAVIEELAVL